MGERRRGAAPHGASRGPGWVRFGRRGPGTESGCGSSVAASPVWHGAGSGMAVGVGSLPEVTVSQSG